MMWTTKHAPVLLGFLGPAALIAGVIKMTLHALASASDSFYATTCSGAQILIGASPTEDAALDCWGCYAAIGGYALIGVSLIAHLTRHSDRDATSHWPLSGPAR
ncbi:MAG: hypothetical protein AAGB25_03825 [Pseudomonadota bacterium]